MSENLDTDSQWDEIIIDDEDSVVEHTADLSNEDEDVVTESASDEDDVGAEVVDSDPLYIETPSGDIIDIANPELNYDEATELTDHIRATADMMYVLISRAHAGKAWKALGYSSFKDYVQEEFDISRSRAYQLLDQARVIEEITAAAPDGASFNISEADARDLKSTLDDLVPEIRDRTSNLDDEEDAGVAIEDLVREYRERKEADEVPGGDGESYDEESAGDEADRQGFADYSGGGSGEGGGSGSGGGGFDDTEDDLNDDEIDDLLDFDEDPADVRRKFESVYALYTSLGALKDMPSVEEVIQWIPSERELQVTSSLPHALAWLKDFQKAWGQDNVVENTDSTSEGEEGNFEDFSEDSEIEGLFD